METIFDLPQLKETIRKIEAEIEQPSFWDNNDQAQPTFQHLNRHKATLSRYELLQQQSEDIQVYLDLLSESPEEDSLLADISPLMISFTKTIDELETQCLLSGKYDDAPCIVTINSGAGGTDAQDWADMLLRMYIRYFEQNKFTSHIVEYMAGDEAGIKSATIIVKGAFAYGYLKHEMGVHRLVRLSPYNANNKRQTSFASIDVIPELDQNTHSFTFKPDELRIDTFRASGAGGQHVNKTDSAVRITHLPTGIVAQSQASRSQTTNKETAMALLVSRIAKQLEEEAKDHIDELRGTPKEIAWGNQIRSYVLHPYKMVKDHRTDYESSNAQDVLDGNIFPFIQAALHHTAETSLFNTR